MTFEWSDWRNGWYWWCRACTWSRRPAAGVFRSLFGHLKEKAQADPTVIGLRLYVEDDNQRANGRTRRWAWNEEPYNLMGLTRCRDGRVRFGLDGICTTSTVLGCHLPMRTNANLVPIRRWIRTNQS